MLDDIAAIEDDALPRIAAAATLDDLRALDQELLGKKSVLSSFKAKLGGLDHDGRREVGGALNRVRDSLEAALSGRRSSLELDARRVQLHAERLDLTEVSPT
ncbi:MAG: phenylalanine--tRNA ligase subunit alpha, partial [Acidimicrobiales bacterium]